MCILYIIIFLTTRDAEEREEEQQRFRLSFFSSFFLGALPIINIKHMVKTCSLTHKCNAVVKILDSNEDENKYLSTAGVKNIDR